MSQQTPEKVTVKPVGQAAAMKSNKRHLIWGILCLGGPTVLIIVSLFLYAIINFIFGSFMETNATGETISSPSPFNVILNILLFAVTGFAMLAWLPGIIVGIVLLSNMKKLK